MDNLYYRIIYYDFTNDDELLMATYCLFLLFAYSSKYTYLYEQKLNYIGYDLKNFYNKNNKYSSDEIQKINNENNSKKYILNYLIGLIGFIKEDGFVFCKNNINKEFYIAIICNLFSKYFGFK